MTTPRVTVSVEPTPDLTNEQIQSVMLEAIREVRATVTDHVEAACMDVDIARMERGPVDMGATGWEVMRAVHRRLAMLSAAPAPEGGAVDWSYDLTSCPRSEPFLIAYADGDVRMGHYLDNSKSSVPWEGIRPLFGAERWDAKIIAWAKRPALATREEAPAEAGERGELLQELSDAARWRRLPGNENHLATAALFERAIAALRAQPPAREDAQPVGWQRRIRNTAAPSSSPKSQWSKWVDCDDRQRKDAQETGGVPGFPELIAEVRPIYTHPAPDELRVAVEALRWIDANAGRSDCFEVSFRARQALAALQAEQGAK